MTLKDIEDRLEKIRQKIRNKEISMTTGVLMAKPLLTIRWMKEHGKTMPIDEQ